MTVERTLERWTGIGLTGLMRRGTAVDGPRAVLLHGYGGDETAMWVFAGALPHRWTVLAFRGPAPAEGGGYRWHVGRRWPAPDAAAFDPAVAALRRALPESRGVLWIGFSQGAALAFCCAAAGLPSLGVASLAGTIPADLPRLATGVPVFWAHGRRDDKVPIESARLAARALETAGTRLEFCEGDGGHKVGAECLRALRRWVDRLDRSD